MMPIRVRRVMTRTGVVWARIDSKANPRRRPALVGTAYLQTSVKGPGGATGSR